MNEQAQAAHPGTLWERQHKWNDRIERRLSAVEQKVVFAAGFASAIGAVVGSGVAVVLLRAVFGGSS